MAPRGLIPLLFLSALLCLSGRPASAEEIKIVAIVNDEVITEAELDRALAPVQLQMQATLAPEELAREMNRVRAEVLERLIEERLMLQEARNPRPVEVAKGKVGTPPPIEVTPAEVDEMLREVRGRFPSEEAFTEALAAQGLAEEDLRQRFREQITIRKLIDREARYRVTVSPAEVTEYYQNHPEEFVRPPAVQVSAILIRPNGPVDAIRARGLAQDLLKRLRAGEDFHELARRYSDGLNPETGGRIGWIEKGRGRPEIEQALFGLKPGEFSEVIETPVGLHIFLVESARPGEQMKLEQVQGAIRAKLLNEKAGAKYEAWIARLKSESYITVKQDSFGSSS